LVEAGPRLLPAFPDDLANYARRTLEAMRVEVRTATAVTGCNPGFVTLSDGSRIESETVLWAAGVRASPVAQWLDVPGDRAGRVKVRSDLSVPGRTNVFVVGDAALVQTESGTPVPGIAPAAKQMGVFVARLIAARIRGHSTDAAFQYRHYGDLATIGRKAAIVSFGRVRLRGFVAWVFWSVAHIYFLIGARHRISVAIDWLWDYVTFQRGARLISGPYRQAPALIAAAEEDSVTASQRRTG
jgi:NADH dehydrogenase